MKIVCENCSAKYSISDDKVQGKVFKIRCRKCGESIVVHGVSGASEAAAPSLPAAPAFGGMEEEGDAETRVFDYSGYQADNSSVDTNEWHIVVDGNQQGPYTTDQIKEYITTGSLDLDTYVWRDGFSDWIPAREVREFADSVGTAARVSPPMAQGGFESAVAEGPLAASPAADLFGGGSGGGLFDAQPQAGAFGDSGGGLFGTSASAGAEVDLFAASSQPNRDADVFAAASPSPPSTGGLFSDDSGLFGPSQAAAAEEFTGVSDIFGDNGAPSTGGLFSAAEPQRGGTSPRLSAEQIMMTGQRNESSVLFSLASLQSLAAAQEAKKQPVVTNTGGSEGSGLIDIRALAGSLQQVEPESAAGPAVDDLLSIGGGFGGGLSAPVLVATRQGMSTGAKLGIIFGSIALAAAIVVLSVLLIRKPSEPSPDVQALMAKIAELERKGGGSTAQMAELQAELAKAKAEEPAAETQPPAEPQAVAAAAKDEPKPGEKEPSRREHGSSQKAAGVAGSAASKPVGDSPIFEPSRDAKPAAEPKVPQEAKEPREKKSAGSSELDDLLGEAKAPPTPKKPANEAPAAQPAQSAGGGGSSASGDGVKDSLDRMDVMNGMNSVAAMVKQCGQGEQGTVTLQVVINPAGRVASAEPTGSFAGTPVGACAARAVRTARFPASKNSMTVRYPFKL